MDHASHLNRIEHAVLNLPLTTFVQIQNGTRRSLVLDAGSPVSPGGWLILTGGLDHETETLAAQVIAWAHEPQCGPTHVSIAFGLVGRLPVVRLALPRPVVSLKNRRPLGVKDVPATATRKARKVPITRKSKEMRDDIAMVCNYASLRTAILGAYRTRETVFGPDDAIEFSMMHDPTAAGGLLLHACRGREIGAGRSRRYTERDLHGMSELIADALQGKWWPDDRQIDSFLMRRSALMREPV